MSGPKSSVGAGFTIATMVSEVEHPLELLTINTAGTYVLKVTNASGCSTSDTIVAIVNPAPTLDLGPDIQLCQGESATLKAPSGFQTYEWNGTTGVDSLVVSSQATYTLVVTDNNGCQTSDNVLITVNALPTVDLGPDVAFCEGGSVTISGPSGMNSYAWNGIAGEQEHEVNIAGEVVLLVVDENGCSNSDVIEATVNSLPDTPTLTQNNDTLLSSFSGTNYWYFNDVPIDGESTNQYVITQSGNYYAIAESDAGCLSDPSAILAIIYSDVPDVSLSNIRIYPNPTKGKVRIVSDTDIDELDLYSINGNQLIHLENQGAEVTLDLQNQTDGVYILRMKQNNQIQQFKLLKQ